MRYRGTLNNKTMTKQVVIVKCCYDSKAILGLFKRDGADKWQCVLKANAHIGKRGVTMNKKEGDLKTPLGVFKLGIVFGIHKKIDTKMKYMQIKENHCWVDDVSSKYYNMLVDCGKVDRDWNSSEHLIDYSEQYEYAVEIEYNKCRKKGKGSAIFLHCDTGKPTAGCIAISKEKMIELLKKLEEDAIIVIC